MSARRPAADDSGGPEELAQLRELFDRPPLDLTVLRRTLLVAWFHRRLFPGRWRRDEGLNQRVELVRMIVRERTRSGDDPDHP